jgi:hypothetical protein
MDTQLGVVCNRALGPPFPLTWIPEFVRVSSQRQQSARLPSSDLSHRLLGLSRLLATGNRQGSRDAVHSRLTGQHQLRDSSQLGNNMTPTDPNVIGSGSSNNHRCRPPAVAVLSLPTGHRTGSSVGDEALLHSRPPSRGQSPVTDTCRGPATGGVSQSRSTPARHVATAARAIYSPGA